VSSATRIAPLTGVLFVVLAVLSAILAGEPPDFDSSGEDVISFYADDDTAQTWASVLFAWAAIAFVFFAASLRSALRRGAAVGDTLPAVVFGGGLLLAAGLAIFASINFTLADAADEESLEAGAAQALNLMNGDFFFPVAVGFAAMFIATGLAIIRGRALPVAFGWVALILGIIGFSPLGFFALLLGLLWILVVSVLLATRDESPPAPPAPAASVSGPTI
jgi:hypothetical protein